MRKQPGTAPPMHTVGSEMHLYSLVLPSRSGWLGELTLEQSGSQPPPVPSTCHLCTHRPPSNMKGSMLTPGRYLLGQVLATLGTQTLHDHWVAASFDSHQNRSRNGGQKAEIRRETLGLWFLTPLPEREETWLLHASRDSCALAVK